MAANNLTKAEIKIIKYLRAEGKTVPYIVQYTGRCRSTVYKVLKEAADAK